MHIENTNVLINSIVSIFCLDVVALQVTREKEGDRRRETEREENLEVGADQGELGVLSYIIGYTACTCATLYTLPECILVSLFIYTIP